MERLHLSATPRAAIMQWISQRDYAALGACIAAATIPEDHRKALLQDLGRDGTPGARASQALCNSGRHDALYGLFQAPDLPGLGLDGVRFERLPPPPLAALAGHDLPVVAVRTLACSEGFDDDAVVALHPGDRLDAAGEPGDCTVHFADRLVARHLQRTRPLLERFADPASLPLVRRLDPAALEACGVQWAWLHELGHRSGPASLPAHAEMKAYRPLAALEACRADMLAACMLHDDASLPGDSGRAAAEFILAERLLRCPAEGVPTPGRDAIGSLVLVNFLRAGGHLAIEGGRLRLAPCHMEGVRGFVAAIHAIEARLAAQPVREVQQLLLDFINAHLGERVGARLARRDPFFLQVHQALQAAAPAAAAATVPDFPTLAQGMTGFAMAADPQGLREAMAWLQQRMAAEALQGRAAFALDLCLDEAGANILMHGYPHLRPGAPASLAPRVRLGFRRRGAIATLELQDNGIPFDPSTYVPRKLPRTLQDAETGGQGIRLMRNYLCDMQYRRQGGWNILSLSVNVD